MKRKEEKRRGEGQSDQTHTAKGKEQREDEWIRAKRERDADYWLELAEEAIGIEEDDEEEEEEDEE